MNEEFYKPLTLEIYKNLLPEGHMVLNVSPEIYEYIRGIFRDADMIHPLICHNRNTTYKESIYIWRKP